MDEKYGQTTVTHTRESGGPDPCFRSLFQHYLVHVLVHSTISKYSFYIVSVFLLVLVLENKKEGRSIGREYFNSARAVTVAANCCQESAVRLLTSIEQCKLVAGRHPLRLFERDPSRHVNVKQVYLSTYNRPVYTPCKLVSK